MQKWAAFDQSIQCLKTESREELFLITLKIDTRFEGKLTCASKNDMKNFAKSKNWGFYWVLLFTVENV